MPPWVVAWSVTHLSCRTIICTVHPQGLTRETCQQTEMTGRWVTHSHVCPHQRCTVPWQHTPASQPLMFQHPLQHCLIIVISDVMVTGSLKENLQTSIKFKYTPCHAPTYASMTAAHWPWESCHLSISDWGQASFPTNQPMGDGGGAYSINDVTNGNWLLTSFH